MKPGGGMLFGAITALAVAGVGAPSWSQEEPSWSQDEEVAREPDLVAVESELVFASEEGEPVTVPPGSYRVGDAGAEVLVLVPAQPGGEAVTLAAVTGTHAEEVPAPVALWVEGEAGATHLVLLEPDGRQLSAAGSPPGVGTRGKLALPGTRVSTTLRRTVRVLYADLEATDILAPYVSTLTPFKLRLVNHGPYPATLPRDAKVASCDVVPLQIFAMIGPLIRKGVPTPVALSYRDPCTCGSVTGQYGCSDTRYWANEAARTRQYLTWNEIMQVQADTQTLCRSPFQGEARAAGERLERGQEAYFPLTLTAPVPMTSGLWDFQCTVDAPVHESNTANNTYSEKVQCLLD